MLPAAQHERADPVDERLGLMGAEVGSVPPGVETFGEERLARPERADPRQDSLVEERRGEGPPVVLAQEPGRHLGGIPVLAEDVGAEVPDEAVLVAGPDEVDLAQREPERRPPRTAECRPEVGAGQRPRGLG